MAALEGKNHPLAFSESKPRNIPSVIALYKAMYIANSVGILRLSCWPPAKEFVAENCLNKREASAHKFTRALQR
jgi:hypothetical protein